MKYISENHSNHLLMCHLIFVCKYRKKLLVNVGHDINTEIECIANRYGCKIIDQEIDQDHIHVLIRYSPKWSILEIVRLLKQLTTYRIWQKHIEYLSIFLGNEPFEVMDISHAVLETSAKKLFGNTFKRK